jgi:hypothetical protein
LWLAGLWLAGLWLAGLWLDWEEMYQSEGDFEWLMIAEKSLSVKENLC